MSSSRFMYRFMLKSVLISDPPIVVCMRSYHTGVPCRIEPCFFTNACIFVTSYSLVGCKLTCRFRLVGRVIRVSSSRCGLLLSGGKLTPRFRLLFGGIMRLFSISDRVRVCFFCWLGIASEVFLFLIEVN